MTQTPDDKQKRGLNDNRNFYDVSFDYPEEDSIPSSHRHSSSGSTRHANTDPELYQRYLKQEPPRSSKESAKPASPNQENHTNTRNEWQYEPSDQETVSEKSAKIFNRSVEKIQSLFSGLVADDDMKYNPYVDDLPERNDSALVDPSLPKMPRLPKRYSAEMKTSDPTASPQTPEHTEPAQIPSETLPPIVPPTRTVHYQEEIRERLEKREAPVQRLEDVPSTPQAIVTPERANRAILTRRNTPLPTPEEIRQERDRRRRLRIEELATLETTDEVLKTHRGLFHQTTTDTPSELVPTEPIIPDTPVVDMPPAVEEPITAETPQEPVDTIVTPSVTDEPSASTEESISVDQVLTGAAIATAAVGALNSTSASAKTSHNTIDSITEPVSEPEIEESQDSSDDFATETNEPAELTFIEETIVTDDTPSEEPSSEEKTAATPRKKRRSKYSLKNFSLKERVIFGANVSVNVLKRLVLYVVLIGLLLGSLSAGAGIGYFAHLVSQTTPPTREEMAAKINQLEQLSAIYYANGEKIANVQTDVVRSVTELSEVSPFIIDGLVATEDEHFYEHPGVVPKAILRATLQSIISLGAATGGSTITQQLVKQRLLTNDVTFFRKANEILLALRLENFFSKDEILTAYLNVSPFGRNNSGENIAGIAKASEGVFGKKTSEVSLPQAAFLVGLPQNPYGYTPYDQHGNLREDHSAGIERMKEVLFRMYRTQKITKEAYEEALAYDITQDFLPTAPKSPERQSYLYQAMMQGAIEQLMRLNIQQDRLTWDQVYADDDWYNQYYFAAEQQLKTGGYKVYTTIDKQIYDQLQTSAKQYVGELGVAHEGIYVDPETGHEQTYIETVQNGFVVMDNATGKVLGFISGTDYDTNQIDHAFSVRRSPGSTIKPLAVYGPAIEENIINPATMIPDTAFIKTFEDGTAWTPTNYGGVVSGGNESARVALYKSDNLPAVRVYQELLNRHVDIVGYLEKMGFSTASSYSQEDVGNLAFSIGGVSKGPTVLEETRAFATFANGGQYIEGYYIDRIEDSEGNVIFQHELKPSQVFSEDTNYLMVDILRDTMSEGTARIARGYMEMGGDWIAKTGISENSKDVWMIASTPAITIGSWIGYDSKYANLTINIEDGYGRESERSQLYWSRVVNDLYRIRPDIFGVDRVFEQPASVLTTPVLQATGTLPGTVALDNGSFPISGPVYEDVFKVSNPAPALSYHFLFGATDEELANFWATYRAQLEEQRRRQQQQQSSSSSSSSSQSESSSSDESSQPNNEQTNTDTNNNGQ